MYDRADKVHEKNDASDHLSQCNKQYLGIHSKNVYTHLSFAGSNTRVTVTSLINIKCGMALRVINRGLYPMLKAFISNVSLARS